MGGDAAHNKTTFLTYFSVTDAEKYAEALTDKAILQIEKWNDREVLCDLAMYLLERKY